MKIAFHDNIISVRGTTVALYDYAFFNKHLLHNDSIILYNLNYSGNDRNVYHKFSKEFKIFGYKDASEIDSILRDENCDAFFAIKGGKFDGITSSICRNLIMAVAANVTREDIHGDKFFVCSPWLSQVTGIDFVPHMINLPDVNDDLREDLGISRDAFVFGRNGGYETFDLDFVKAAVSDSLKQREDFYFIFQNTEKFINHPRAIFLESNPDLDLKVRFINTCDAHLHARFIGESFGLTCGEFSTRNKPVITWNGSPERNHISILGEKGLLYNNYEDLMKMFFSFEKRDYLNWNCYGDYSPDLVMQRFRSLYEV